MANRGMLAGGVVVCVLALGQWAPVLHSQSSQQTRIVSDAELVEIPIIVFDDKGSPAADLTRENFRVFEDGVEQQVTGLTLKRVPVSLVLVADLSSSMTHKIPFVQEAALSLFDSDDQAKSKDEYSVLSVGRRSKVLLPFTNDQADMEKRLPSLLEPTGESTALLDGIWMGTDTADESARNAARAMVVITDGGDNHSRYSLRETKKMVEEADVPVFSIMAGSSFWLSGLLSQPEPPPVSHAPTSGGSRRLPGIGQLRIPLTDDDHIGPAERRGPYNMKVLADASGGGVFTAKREEDLPRIARTIGVALRYRYILTYAPDRFYRVAAKSAEGGESQVHKIHLELYPKEKFAGYSIPYYKKTYQSFR